MKRSIQVKENSPRQWRIPPLCAQDHKYTRGSVLILGGEEMTGAARLAALAAQRAGAGLVTIAATKPCWPVYAAAMLSVMVRVTDAKGWAALASDKRLRTVLIGPGAGVNARTKSAMLATTKAGVPMVLDADALTLLARDATLRRAVLPSPKIITPHEGEWTPLVTALKVNPGGDRVTLARALAHKLRAVVVLKGAQTVAADGNGRALVTYPPHWLATAGTGDVLAGVIAGLVAQGMAGFDAAAAGVWLHAQAARQHGRGMIAEDVVAALPKLLREIG